MKKTIVLLIAILVFYLFISNVFSYSDEMIRIRVIPNSNLPIDQSMKEKVKELLTNKMSSLLSNTKSVDDARYIIKNNMKEIDYNIEKLFQTNNYQQNYDINYGDNYFPEKEYNGITYKSGYYESLVVTIGEGKGDNWWCFLFPPLCLLEVEESEEVEYDSFFLEIIQKYF